MIHKRQSKTTATKVRFKEGGRETCNSGRRQTTAQKVAGVQKLGKNKCMTNVQRCYRNDTVVLHTDKLYETEVITPKRSRAH